MAVTEEGHPILGAGGSEELFGRGPGFVVRIELARGRVTTTTVPSLNSSGPVSFVVTRHEAIVRPIDLVPAYEVPDGKPAQPFGGPLRNVQDGPIFPGPDGNSVWAVPDDVDPPVLRLVRLDGGSSTSTLPMPRGASPLSGIPDGSGYVAVPGSHGTYDSTPGGLRRVTTGTCHRGRPHALADPHLHRRGRLPDQRRRPTHRAQPTRWPDPSGMWMWSPVSSRRTVRPRR